MNGMSGFQLGWVVGIFEGEGSFVWSDRGNGSVQARVQVAMTDLDTIERLQEFTGLGNISGPYRTSSGLKPIWYWSVGDQVGFRQLSAAMRPHLSTRRTAKLDEVLSALDKHLNDKAARRAASFNPGTGVCRNNHDRSVEGVLKGTNKCLACHRNRSRKARA